jgi:hypothetical protein
LQSRNTLFAGQHHVSDAKPVAERLIGILPALSPQRPRIGARLMAR